MPATYEPIASQTLGSDTATVEFTSIPGTFTDLVLVCFERGTDNSASGALRFNADTGSNYSRTRLLGFSSGAISTRDSNDTSILAGSSALNNATSGIFSTSVHQIMSYANANVYKTVLASAADPSNTDSRVHRVVGLWRSTSAITTITYLHRSANFAAGSTFSLYGIKAARCPESMSLGRGPNGYDV